MNLFEDTYLTIAKPSEGIFRNRGSKFIGFAFPVTSEAEIKEHLGRLRKDHFGANHHCYAYRLGADKSAYRANDDGEPANSAGKPILGQIQSRDLTNILIVVARYFGGTLLGVSGLINAYRTAAAEALANAEIVEKQVYDVYEIKFEYPVMNDVMRVVKDEELGVLAQDFALSCALTFTSRQSQSDRVTALFRNIDGVSVQYLRTY